MEIAFSKIARASLRTALRAPVAQWKRWREPALASRTKYPLAVCAIFREEAPFLDEWLAFHAGLGVTHFYLYNNFSTDNFRAVLQPWQAAGLVTLTEWPVAVGQLSAYRDCLRRFKKSARWIAFIDVDEFLFATGGQSLPRVLENFAGRPGIEVWQIFFGANGHLQRPAAPVTEAFTRCAPPSQTTVKTIANPRLAYKAGVHQFKFWTGGAADTAGQIAGRSVTPVFDVLRINHYWSRSLADLQTKIQRGDASTAAARDPDWHLKFERGLNEHEDLTIQPVAQAIHQSRKKNKRHETA